MHVRVVRTYRITCTAINCHRCPFDDFFIFALSEKSRNKALCIFSLVHLSLGKCKRALRESCEGLNMISGNTLEICPRHPFWDISNCIKRGSARYSSIPWRNIGKKPTRRNEINQPRPRNCLTARLARRTKGSSLQGSML